MKNEIIQKLQTAFDGAKLTDYQCVPFWSWNNELDKPTLLRQIEEMKAAGVGGFIIHARTGLKTEYLGEKWFDCIDGCLKKAKELHMNAWIYDENGWPSGFVGGKLLENEAYRARFLEYEVKESFDESALRVFKRTENGFAPIEGDEAGVDEYHCVYLRISPANTDVLNPVVVEEFIKETHEEYYKRFKDSFGKELVGFFTDEPQYYRWATAYTPVAQKVWKERYGEELNDGLVYLFVHDARGYVFRERYWQLLNELFTNHFVKRCYDWCEAHGCKLTGHMVEENSLPAQMLGGAAVMPPYEYEHIPGIDSLGRWTVTNLSVRQVASAASQLEKKQVLTEQFACCGYDVTPRELKGIAQHQFFGGASLMCQHLLPMSVAGQGKYDHPPVFSKHGNWWEEFKVFNDYFTRLGYIVSNTRDVCDVAVLHPMRAVYLEYVRSEYDTCVKALDGYFKEFLQGLRKAGVRYHLIDEALLARHGKAEGDTLRVGAAEYSTLIVPDMKTVSRETLEILKGYTGKLYLDGELTMVDGKPTRLGFSSNISMEEIVKARGVKFTCEDGRTVLTSRVGELGDFLFLANTSRTEESRVRMEGVAESYQALRLDTMTLENITNDLTLRPFEGYVLVRSGAAKEEKKVYEVENITSSFEVTSITENSLLMDYAECSFDGVSYGERQPLQQIFERLLREQYKGKVYIRHTFTAKEKVAAKLLLEKGNYLSVTFNGKPVSLSDSDFDVYFAEADISAWVKAGENEFVYCLEYAQHDGVWFALFHPLATESLRNCLYYDTHIEPVYVQGDFIVGEDLALEKKIAPLPVTSDTAKRGYPFFKGAITLTGGYTYDGVGRRFLSLEKGRFLVSRVKVNGKEKPVVLDDRTELTELLEKGENTVEIVLKSGLRNFFGPHHLADNPEPLGVNPSSFTFRKQWENGVPAGYTHEYFSVPFGLDEVLILKTE